MADIELVIKIPKEMWERVKEGYVPLGINKYLRNSTPLPKGHGRLIDADYITKDLNTLQDSFTINIDSVSHGVLSIGCNALTIIEADTESEVSE